MGPGKNKENEKMEEKGKVEGSKKSKSYYLTQHNFSSEYGNAIVFFMKNSSLNPGPIFLLRHVLLGPMAIRVK